MAFRSNIYEENQLNAYRKAQEAQRQAEEEQRQAYERALQAQNAVAQAPQQRGALESVLAGIADKLNTAKEGLVDFFGTGGAAVADLFSGNAGTGKFQNDWKEYRKKTRYNDENMSDKDYYTRTGGTALDTAATISELIPAVGTIGKGATTALNLGQGAIGGMANPLIQKGSNASLEDVLRGGTVGLAGSAVGQAVGNKLGSMAPATSRLGKIATSNIGRGAITGAASGAVGGGLTSALNGGDIGDVLGSAVQGGYQGGIGGGATAAVMGVTNRAAQKVGGRLKPKAATPAEAPDVVNKTTQAEPEAVQNIAQKVAQENADVATAPTKRNIPITDYDNGEVPIKVRGANQGNRYSLGKGQGSLIDGILAPDNARQLPNATKPTHTIGEYMGVGDNVTDAATALPKLIEQTYGSDFNKATFNDLIDDLDAPTKARLTQAVQEAAAMDNLNADEYLNIDKKTDLPKISRADYIKATGYSGKDIPEYIRPYLSKNGVSLGDGSWSQYMPKYNDSGTFTGTPDDVLQMYDTIINGTNRSNANIYTPENIGMALGVDSDLNKAVTDQYMRTGYPTSKIDVNGAPSIADNIDVQDNNLAPVRTTKRVLNPNVAEAQPAQRAAAQTVSTQETPLIQKGTPEYDEMMRQENIANRKRELRQNIVGGIMDQYGTTRLNDRINGLDDAIMDLAEIGLTKRSQIDGFANRITGADGEIPKVIRKSLNDAGDIPAQMNKSMQQVYEESGAAADQGAQKRIKSFFDSRNKKYATNEDGTMARLDMYDLGKECEKEGYKMVDRAYRTQNPSTEAYGEALVNISRQLIEQATDGVDIRANLNVNKLKNILPGNDAWAAKVDDFIANAKTVQDARSFIASPTKLSLLAQAEQYNANTYGQRMGDMGETAAKSIRAATSANPVVAGMQIVAAKGANSKVAKQGVIKKNLKEYQTLNGQNTAPTGKTSATKELASELYGGAKNIAKKTGQKIGNVVAAANTPMPTGNWADNGAMERMTLSDAANLPGMNASAFRNAVVGINNLVNNQNTMGREISRQAALSQLYNADAARAQQEAQTNYQNALQDYSNASNQVLQAQNDVENARAQVGTSRGTGTMDTIAQAMDRALAVGDITSYSKLADLYKQAYSIYQLQNPTATSSTSDAKALNATQAKAVTGLSQLQQLASMQPGARTALSNSPLSGFIDLTGGDSYNSQADSLASTIGYLLSGATVKPDEKEAIKRDYIPSTFDSPAVRQQKLSRAEQLLRNYLADTNALTAL